MTNPNPQPGQPWTTSYLAALAGPAQVLAFMPQPQAFRAQTVRQAVRLRRGGSIDVTVDDDGSGAHGCEREGGHGVLGMRERALALGGSFAMMPRSPQGMRIAVRIPAAAMRGDAEHAA